MKPNQINLIKWLQLKLIVYKFKKVILNIRPDLVDMIKKNSQHGI